MIVEVARSPLIIPRGRIHVPKAWRECAVERMQCLGSTGMSSQTGMMSTVFNPLTLSPTMWLQGGNYANSTGTWTDTSGNGRDAVQSTSSNRPSDATLNGLNIPSFDGTNDVLTNATAISTLLSTSAWTVGLLVNVAGFNTNVGDSLCWTNEAILSDTGAFWGIHAVSTSPAVKAYQFDTTAKVASASYPGTNQWAYVGARYDGTDLRICVNRDTVQTAASGAMDSATGTLNIGKNFGAEFMQLMIADVILIASATSDQTIQVDLRNYANAKYLLNL